MVDLLRMSLMLIPRMMRKTSDMDILWPCVDMCVCTGFVVLAFVCVVSCEDGFVRFGLCTTVIDSSKTFLPRTSPALYVLN